jgi:hypothetical protein
LSAGTKTFFDDAIFSLITVNLVQRVEPRLPTPTSTEGYRF